MSALALRLETDYRIVYMKEDLFSEHITNVYIATHTENGAPFFDQIVSELLEIRALLLIEVLKRESLESDNKPDITYEELEELEGRIEQYGDMEAAVSVLHRFEEPGFLELFHRDVYYYLMEKQLAFFMREKEYQQRKESISKNEPVTEVW